MSTAHPVRAGDLQRRTFELAVQVALLSRGLPRTPEAGIIRWQMLRAATSTAANYRAACRAQSKRTFVAKISIALEEADEVVFWLALVERLGLAHQGGLSALAEEAGQLVAILAASRKTARRRS
jgi:four helix bundle protein